MIEETVDLRFLAKQGQKIIEDMCAFRQEVSEVRTLALQTYEYSRRIERLSRLPSKWNSVVASLTCRR
ncbi:hypothetical protein OE766_11600 [Pararhizobium sp. YC-54]|uniref:hypothetical protein n=1 Tax=Pararhizobium sp. YC-54 TaxID=2986920 RepID=UPI0021F77A89|nr:hypothetical protein [Pararhizobium sp. YC-54]MCV9998895.1 hypothetical protein [Pararhizobium sp. YC-54]